eukprot:6457333-Amphidinium_carterae.1
MLHRSLPVKEQVQTLTSGPSLRYSQPTSRQFTNSTCWCTVDFCGEHRLLVQGHDVTQLERFASAGEASET